MGVEIDLQANTASIPQGKVDKVMAYLDVVAKSPGKRQKVGFWEELLGILNWISSVLVSGRFHLAQIVSARRAAAGYGHARATPSLAADCRWWANVVTKWNRVAILLPLCTPLPPTTSATPWPQTRQEATMVVAEDSSRVCGPRYGGRRRKLNASTSWSLRLSCTSSF